MSITANGGNPLTAVQRHHLSPGQQKTGVGLIDPPANPATQLIKFGQSETVSPLYYNGIGILYIHAGFNYGSTDQYIDISGNKRCHYRFKFILIHLPMGNGYSGRREILLQAQRTLLYRLYPVMQIIDLPATVEFQIYSA